MFSRRTPLFLQMEAAECGAACLAMALARHGRWITLEEARER
jgi:ABC-type bacteriocin/lantibiotic exporter with double-glycine peptidase domain